LTALTVLATVKMTLFILTETSAGYALFKARDKKLLKKDDLAAEAESAEGISNM
jgi:nucleolar protein 58